MKTLVVKLIGEIRDIECVVDFLEEHFEVLHESRLRKNIDTPGYHKFLDLLPRRKEVEIIDR